MHGRLFKAILGIAVAIVAPYALAYIAPTLFGASSLATALATGALSGFASTGTLKGALTGAFTAGIMFGVGEIGAALKEANIGGFESGGIGKIALHAGAGCISSVAGGGDCKTGAMSAAVGQLGLHLPEGSREFNAIKAAMLGGIGSKLSGGKFEDGAVTGAFGYLFNDAMKHGKDDLLKTKNKLDKISDVLDIKKNYDEGYELGKVDKQLALKDDSIRQERIDKNPDDAQRQESAKGSKTFSTGMAGPASMALEHFSIKNPIATIPKVKGYYDGYTGN